MDASPKEVSRPYDDDIQVGRCDALGEIGGVGSTADKKVVSRNWREVECEAVEDEDAGHHWEHQGEGDDDEEEEEMEEEEDYYRGEQEENEHRTQVGSTSVKSVVSRNWKTVEYEEVEDDDAGCDWENKGEGDREEEQVVEDDGGEEEENTHRTRWTCHICCTTINIFARDDHLRSRLHRQRTGITRRSPSPRPSPPAWHCALCDEDMSIFQQPYHIASKPHLTACLHHTNRHNPTPRAIIPSAPLPTLARSSSFEFRNTFYCLTCAAEFDRVEEELHLGTTDIWVCELCSSRMHPAARERHVDSEMHTTRKRASKAPERVDEVGTVCQCTYPFAEQADHLPGLVHPINHAGSHIGTHGLAEKSTANNPSPLVRADKTWYCDICRMDVEWERLASHLVAHYKADGAPATGRPADDVPPVKKPRKSEKARNTKETEAGSIYCNVCKNYENTKGIVEHLNSKGHRNKLANYHPGTEGVRQDTAQDA